MKHRRSSVGRTRLILILLCIVLAAAMLWCALSLILRVGTYSGRTVGKDPVQEQTPVEPVDLEPTVPENSYDPAGFYEEGGFKRYKSEDTLASVGVDVSSHQQEIDWELVAANGVEFAMIRVGYRGYSQGGLQMDERFRENMDGALAAGLDVGVYFFSQAITVEEALEEARFVLERVRDYDLTMPVVFDWERQNYSGSRTQKIPDTETMCRMANAFCEEIQAEGYQPMVYFYQNLAYNNYDLSKIMEHPFWLAQYTDYPSFYYDFEMWQYTHTASVPGIEGNVDMNLAFREFDEKPQHGEE